jgi:antitoxin component HigA of HigAB toxin-antitoxin module
MKTIKSKKEYETTIKHIETYLNKITEAGESDGLTAEEHDELKVLSSLVADYEDTVLKIYPLTAPTPLVISIEQEMHKRRLKQRDLALLLGISESRISNVLRGKSRIGITLAKRMHDRLGIDGNLILEHS